MIVERAPNETHFGGTLLSKDVTKNYTMVATCDPQESEQLFKPFEIE